MKSLALFIVLSIFISFAMSNEASASTDSPCESKCMACQQTAYNLKFHRKANCQKNHCRTTVFFIL